MCDNRKVFLLYKINYNIFELYYSLLTERDAKPRTKI